MNYLLPVVYTLIFGWLFYKYHPLEKGRRIRVFVLLSFGYKLLMGFALWYIYTYIYVDRDHNDIYRFYDDALVMYEALGDDPLLFFNMLTGIGGNQELMDTYYMRMNNWYKEYNYFVYNDARTLIRFNALITIFSFKSYAVHIIFMSAFSYFGSLYLIKSFYHFVRNYYLLFAVVMLVPSVAFWSAGVLKEGIFMGGFGIFLYALFEMVFNRRISVKLLTGILLSAILLLVIKVYLFLCLIPGTLFLLSFILVKKGKAGWRFVIIQALVLMILVLLPWVIPQLDIFYILYKKRMDFIGEGTLFNAGSLVDVPELQPNAWSFLAHIPFALSLVFFRPFPWEANSILMLFASIENIFLVLPFLLPVIAFRKPDTVRWMFVLFGISFVAYLYILIGTTTPILGSLVRYKIPGIPVLLTIILVVTDFEKLKQRLRLRS